MFLRKFTLIFLVLSFLCLPHDQVSGGMLWAVVLGVLQTLLIVAYLADCVEDFLKLHDTSRKVRNFLWLGLPLAIQVFYLDAAYASTVGMLWVFTVLMLLMMKFLLMGSDGGKQQTC